MAELPPSLVDDRLRELAALSDRHGRPWPSVDMGIDAVTLRLQTLAELCDMCAALPDMRRSGGPAAQDE